MSEILHIVTNPDELSSEVIQLQKVGGVQLTVVDLTDPATDYDALLEKIFQADSVQVW